MVCPQCVKSVQRVFPGPYFPAFGLNTERYGVFLHIQSKYRKIRTRKNSVFGHFSLSTSVSKDGSKIIQKIIQGKTGYIGLSIQTIQVIHENNRSWDSEKLLENCLFAWKFIFIWAFLSPALIWNVCLMWYHLYYSRNVKTPMVEF